MGKIDSDKNETIITGKIDPDKNETIIIFPGKPWKSMIHSTEIFYWIFLSTSTDQVWRITSARHTYFTSDRQKKKNHKIAINSTRKLGRDCYEIKMSNFSKDLTRTKIFKNYMLKLATKWLNETRSTLEPNFNKSIHNYNKINEFSEVKSNGIYQLESILCLRWNNMNISFPHFLSLTIAELSHREWMIKIWVKDLRGKFYIAITKCEQIFIPGYSNLKIQNDD